jgi:dienelactone hydrolase
MHKSFRRSVSLIFLLIILSVVQVIAATTAKSNLTVEEIIANTRTAVGYEQLKKHDGGIMLNGRAKFLGLEAKYSLLFNPAGHFLSTIESRLGQTVGFDGTTGWTTDWSGMPRILQLEDLEVEQIAAWVQSGRWLADERPFVISIINDQTNQQQVALSMKLKSGLVTARLFIDRTTWLPTRLSRDDVSGEESLRFEDYRTVLGVALPHRIIQSNRRVSNTIRIESVTPAPVFKRNPYQPLTTAPDDTTFNNSIPPRIEVKRVASGHLLVHPRIDGQDVGWFILDTGAGAMVINPKAADKINMPTLGKVVATGVVGSVTARFRQGSKFELGPITIANTIYVELDLGFLSPIFGVEVAGICGYDLFSRAVTEIETAASVVNIYDPRRYQLAGATWQALILDDKIPCARASFEGSREGLFKIDTGANGTVTFHAPAVEAFGLLNGRKTETRHSGGVGGVREERVGKIEWFELAGHRFENPPVRFSLAREGAFSKPYVTGNLGGEFLAPFRIVLNYPQRQIAFVPVAGRGTSSNAERGQTPPSPPVASGAQASSLRELTPLFDYDRKQPLDVQETLLKKQNGITLYDISYASPKGGRVTAFLVVPPGKGPFAGMVFGHWGPGTRTEFLPDAMLYAEAGVVSIMIDYPWVRPAPWRRSVENFDQPELDREAYIQAVVDVRRAFDVLEARPDVDAGRIGYVGHSYGAQWGAILSAVDKRMKATVLIGGVAAQEDIFASHDPSIQAFVQRMDKEIVRKYIEVLQPLDAINYVPHAAPVPLFFQFARYERFFNEDSMKRYERAARAPKLVMWYDTGHELNDIQALIDRTDWLGKQLGLKYLTPVLQAKLKKKS